MKIIYANAVCEIRTYCSYCTVNMYTMHQVQLVCPGGLVFHVTIISFVILTKQRLC